MDYKTEVLLKYLRRFASSYKVSRKHFIALENARCANLVDINAVTTEAFRRYL